MPNQPKTPARSFRVGDPLHADAKRIAAERGETLTAVVVRALEAYVFKHRLLKKRETDR